MTASHGFFIDWNGNARSTSDIGGHYLAEIDEAARYVAITAPNGSLVHEGTFFRQFADIAKAGINAELVPGSHPWGQPSEGF